jgi:DNA-binding transcriptional LysR family regulator
LIRHSQLIGEGQSGEVKIGFVGSAMQNVIPKLIKEVTKQFPDLHFSFEELRNDTQVESILLNELDLGFVRLTQVPEDLIMKPVYEDTFSLVTPKNHPINQDNFTSLEQFSEEAFILFKSNYSPAYFRQIVGICEDHGFHPKVVHNSVHASTIYRLVESGLGVSIVPTALKDGYKMEVNFIELKNIRQKAQLSIIWSKRNRNPALKNVLGIVAPEMIKKV